MHIRLEDILGYHFFEKGALDSALTRTSYAREHQEDMPGITDQNLLIVLGELVKKTALIHLLIRSGLENTDEIYSYIEKMEQKEMLAAINKKLPIEGFIRKGAEEEVLFANERENLVISTQNALIGAIFIDGGFEAAEQRIKSWMGEFLP